MNHPYIDFLIEKAKSMHGRVAVPDAQHDERVLEAACRMHNNGWLDVILTGSRAAYQALAKKHGFDISGIEIIDPDETDSFPAFCEEYGRIRAKEGLSAEQIEQLMREPVYLACMLHRHGIVEGICSGVYYSTAELARASIKCLGMLPGAKKITALAVIVFEHTAIGDNLVYCTADGTILPNPNSEELAEIAILSADKAKTILPDKPRVAMLSFSTTGSAKHEMVDKVVRALEMVRARRPDICIDGEFQIDSALSPHVASKKVKRPSEVAGRANVLIWPDLQSGNMAGKGMMLVTNGMLVGATFLGLNGFVNDHSRGATVEEIMTNIAFVGAQIER